MKKLTILCPYEGYYFAGSHISSLVMAQALAGRGHRPIIAVHGEGRILEEARAAGLETKHLPQLTHPDSVKQAARARLAHFAAVPQLVATINELRPDIVHVNDLAMLRTWAAPSVLARRPLFVHWRSNYRKSVTVGLGLRAGAKIAVVSRYSLERLPAFAQAKSVVVYDPLPQAMEATSRAAARQRIRQSLDIPENAAVLGVFGSLLLRKRTYRLPELLAAMPQTEDGRPVYGLHCGDRLEPGDPDFDRLIAEHGLEPRMRSLGFVRPVEDYMAACDVVLMPAREEPFGRTPFEALSVATPVAISAVSGAAELLADKPFARLIDGDAFEPWLEATRELLRPQQDFSAGAAALLAKHSLSAHVDEIEALYAGLSDKAR